MKLKDGYKKLINASYKGSDSLLLKSNGGNIGYSSSSTASTIVLRDGNQFIKATYYHSNIGLEDCSALSSIYVENNSDKWIRKISRANFDTFYLGIRLLATSTDISTLTAPALYWTDTDGNSATLTNSAFSTSHSMILMKNYIGSETDYRRSAIAFDANGTAKLMNDGGTNGTAITWNTILTSGNSSVSGGGSSAGSSITVNLGGTSKTLTIPSSLPSHVRITGNKFSLYTLGIYTKILEFTTTANTYYPSITFTWHPSECARNAWIEGTISIRSRTIVFMTNTKGTLERELWCVGNTDTYSVWVKGTKTSYDPYGVILINNTYGITSYSTGNLAYSDTAPGGTKATKGGMVSYADSASTASKVANNLIIKINNGTTEGTNLWTYNGSAAKTINLTAVNSGSTLAWGTASTVGTVMGVALKVTMPANPNTDYRVTQSAATSTSNYRSLVLGYQNSTSVATLDDTVTNLVYTTTNIYALPSTGTIFATLFLGNLNGGINIKATNPATSTTYYPTWTTGFTSGTYYNLNANDGIRYVTLQGTTSAVGYGKIYLGNATASGTAGNKYGELLMYGNDANYWLISGDKAAGAARTIYLPKSNGCLVVATNNTTVGGTSLPVYISSAGVATVCNSYPTSLKNPYTLTFTAGTFTAKTYDGSAAVTVNVPSNFNHIGNAANKTITAGTVERKIIITSQKQNLGYISRVGLGLSNPANSFSPAVLSVGTNDYGTTFTDYYFSTSGSITDSKGNTYAKTSLIPSIPSISITNSGSGNAVTSITASDHTLTVTKGNTFLTSHQSLANYVTLDTNLTITGVKTFSKLLKFTIATGTSPFTVVSKTKVDNLNADLLDGINSSAIPYAVNPDGGYGTSNESDSSSLTRTMFWRDNNRNSIGLYVGHSSSVQYGWELRKTYTDNKFYTRVKNDGTWSEEKTLAFTSDIGNGTITITQGGTTKGSFTLNLSGNATIALTDNNTTYSFSASNPTLSWGTTSTIGTAGGTTYKVTMPSNTLGGYDISSFMTYTASTNYVAARFTSSTLYEKAANTYIEYWGSSGWFNCKWGEITALNGLNSSGGLNAFGGPIRLGASNPDGTSYPYHHRINIPSHSEDDTIKIYENTIRFYANGGNINYSVLSAENGAEFYGTDTWCPVKINANSSEVAECAAAFLFSGTLVGAVGFYSGEGTYLYNANASEKLYLDDSGNVLAKAFFENSDIRLKTNISSVDYSLAEKINIVEFDWKKDGKHSIGVIAQELEELYPYMVSNKGKYKTVDYHRVSLLKIKYLEEEIKELKSIIKELKNKL